MQKEPQVHKGYEIIIFNSEGNKIKPWFIAEVE